jgi:hypothetical protein
LTFGLVLDSAFQLALEQSDSNDNERSFQFGDGVAVHCSAASHFEILHEVPLAVVKHSALTKFPSAGRIAPVLPIGCYPMQTQERLFCVREA